jgi:hypothetical protein
MTQCTWSHLHSDVPVAPPMAHRRLQCVMLASRTRLCSSSHDADDRALGERVSHSSCVGIQRQTLRNHGMKVLGVPNGRAETRQILAAVRCVRGRVECPDHPDTKSAVIGSGGHVHPLGAVPLREQLVDLPANAGKTGTGNAHLCVTATAGCELQRCQWR